jgi:hypothetical protein
MCSRTRDRARGPGAARGALRLAGALAFGFGTAALAWAPAPTARATPTDPTLALTRALAAAGESHRLVRVEGSFHAEDLIQLAYPLQVLIRETTSGTAYVRYDLSGSAATGVAPELADGLQADEAEGLLAQGGPAPAARVTFLGLGRIDLLLPASFPGGPAEVQLFVIDEGEPVLSNALPLTLEVAP